MSQNESGKPQYPTRIPIDQWDSFVTPLGNQIHQVAEKQSQILFQQQGQKIKFKEIGPRLNGFYTCVYRSSCDSEYRFIGKII